MKRWRVRYKDAGGAERTLSYDAPSQKAAVRGLETAVWGYWKEQCGGSPDSYWWDTYAKPLSILSVKSVKEQSLS